MAAPVSSRRLRAVPLIAPGSVTGDMWMSGWTLILSPSDTWPTVPEVFSFPEAGTAGGSFGLGVQSVHSSSNPQITVSSVLDVGLGQHQSGVPSTIASPSALLASQPHVSEKQIGPPLGSLLAPRLELCLVLRVP
jgi:hypothetical protein